MLLKKYLNKHYKIPISEFKLIIFQAEAIDRHAKKDVKVITIGNIEATIINECAKSIPSKNITTMGLIFSRIVGAQVSAKLGRTSDEISKIIPWGTNGTRLYPDFKFATFKNGEPVIAKIKKAWLKKDLPHVNLSRFVVRFTYRSFKFDFQFLRTSKVNNLIKRIYFTLHLF